MKKRFSNYFSIIFPSKRINIFLVFIIILGIISGTIFTLAISNTDKNLVINQFASVLDNINKNNINNLVMFKNCFNDNIILLTVIFIFGMSLIATIANVLLIYFKSFSIGFILASIFSIYSYKGFIFGIIYLLTSGFICLISLFITGIYSLYFSISLCKFIFLKDKEVNIKIILKRYIVIYIVSLILIIINSLLEGYLFPSLIKLFIKIFI